MARCTASQVQHNLAERSVERELLQMARALDLGVTAWSPLAAGLLSGKYASGPRDPAIAWLRQRPDNVVPIVGARTPAQLESNLASVDVVLEPAHLARLEEPGTPVLGFPQAFLATDTVRAYSTSGHYGRLDNHRLPDVR